MTPTAAAAHAATKALTAADWASMSQNELRTFLDSNDDGAVTNPDLLKLIGAWGAITAPPTEPVPPVVQPPTTGTVQWIGANGQPRSLTITPPANQTPVIVHAGIQATNTNDRVFTGDCVGAVKAFTCENNGSTNRVRVEGFNATYKDYGVYAAAGADAHIRDSHFAYAGGGAESYGLRSAMSEMLIERTNFQTNSGHKRTIWFYGGVLVVIGGTLEGGANWFGAVSSDDVAGTQWAADMGAKFENIVVFLKGVHIKQTRHDMPEAVCIRPGCVDFVAEDCTIDPQAWPAAIDDRRTGHVTFRRCKVGTATMTSNDVRGKKSLLKVEN